MSTHHPHAPGSSAATTGGRAPWWRRLDVVTRAVDPETRAVMRRRWDELPLVNRTANQIIGRNGVGCEGTHGVFPKCNLTCKPCYHSADANKVRTDGQHTLREVRKQMAFFRTARGPRSHAQLIGGEVSLLEPDDHAAALLAMRAEGREPMSMTHGDFDYDYLVRLALDDEGKPRFDRLSFAGHFDSLMRGRRGVPRPRSESDLDLDRRRFVEMFRRLKQEHGVDSFLAHNMTVTPANVDEVTHVARTALDAGFDLVSFQPAAFVGDDRRWEGDFREIGIDDVWEHIEEAVGAPVPYTALQFGDPRCNRTSWGAYVGPQWVPVLDPDDAEDLAARDVFFAHLGGMRVTDQPTALSVVRVLRVLTSHPSTIVTGVAYARRFARRAGGVRSVLRHGVRGTTFVVHAFMDADVVKPAWDLLEQNTWSDDPEIHAVQERLSSCVYAMAHPELGRTVPACVQHGVLDPQENVDLRRELPLFSIDNLGLSKTA